MEYSEYIELRNKAWNEGWHHWQRIARSRSLVSSVATPDCVPFDDPYDLEGPTKVLHPSSRAIGELMLGGIHPPIEAVYKTKFKLALKDETTGEYSLKETQVLRAENKVVFEQIIDYSACHLTTAPPMTYEEALGYLIQKDIPHYIWGKKWNRPMFKIMKTKDLPDRKFRNSWDLLGKNYEQ